MTTTGSYVNEQVCEVGVDSEFKGLGTTVAGVWLAHDEISVFNVDDREMYSITGGQLQQLSHDDAVLGVDGRPTNVIMQSLGQKGPLRRTSPGWRSCPASTSCAPTVSTGC